MKNLIIRTLTGIIFLAVMIGGILYSPVTFSLLFTVITALSVWEFTGIVNQRADVSVNRFITTVAGGCLSSVSSVMLQVCLVAVFFSCPGC